ncbi:8195_t:CDS:2 [Scutellospora calospora]|uniref:8195_t:CDS:1 n=1 Tax=Scutellospora calospora TaxID=85575 RepID=A0ACA9L9S9_9GLOM|nr:8195_t:CDS:2 [Scutellospora calospora]
MSNLLMSEKCDCVGLTTQHPTKHHLENYNNYHQFVQKRRKLNKDSFNSQSQPIQYVEDNLNLANPQVKPQEKIFSQKSVASFPTHRPPSHFGREFCGSLCRSLKAMPNKTCYCSTESYSDPTRYGITDKTLRHFPNSAVPISSVYSPTTFHTFHSTSQQQTMTNNNDYFSRRIDQNPCVINNQYQNFKNMIPVSVNVTNNKIVRDLLPVTNHPDAPKNDNQEFSILNIIPTLIREKGRKAAFVENLVDTACLIVEVIWANFSVSPSAKIISLRVFIQETLRRSRTSYSTLQTALFYLIRIKSEIANLSRCTEYLSTPVSENPPSVKQNSSQNNDPATCGRRMFLAALIVASKYLQDRNYSNRAWSKMSGLPVNEINTNEICFLKLIDYNLFVAENKFKRWSSLLLTHIQAISGTDMSNPEAFRIASNRRKVVRFRDTLKLLDPKTIENINDNFGVYPITPAENVSNYVQKSKWNEICNFGLHNCKLEHNHSHSLDKLSPNAEYLNQQCHLSSHNPNFGNAINYGTVYNNNQMLANNYDNNFEGCQNNRIRRILVRSFA